MFSPQKDRSIIITTHNIDEADVLCSKIAIMSLGRYFSDFYLIFAILTFLHSLKCIGAAQYLKNKFGAGYKLSATLDPTKEADYKA